MYPIRMRATSIIVEQHQADSVAVPVLLMSAIEPVEDKNRPPDPSNKGPDSRFFRNLTKNHQVLQVP
jgi:hypothetical protein